MDKKIFDRYEITIGLEIHARLNTKTKMFGPEINRFGDEPNSNIGLVDTGQPGALPVINIEAVRKAIAFGLAVGSKINLSSSFDRKSYFYPDCPLNYQITQFYHPIISKGIIKTTVDAKPITFTIEHAHLENDAGTLKHFDAFAGVDYNRSGAPLIEIVSDPCMHTPSEAIAYAKAIKAILEYVNASDCNMQMGSMRMDVNCSVRLKGEKELRQKTEIKNMNSFFNMQLAIEAEVLRQIQFYEENPTKSIESGTYRFDLANRRTILMRKKESADDYRYFPEPDLPVMVLTQEFVDQIEKQLPELPADRFERYTQKLGLTPYSANILVEEKTLSDSFEIALGHTKNPKGLCNWITVEFAGRLKEKELDLAKSGLNVEHIAQLVNMIDDKKITGKIAKLVADDMLTSIGKSPEEIVKNNPDYQPLQDTAFIETLVDQALKEHAQSVVDFKAGKDRAFQFLVGQVMKLCRGKAPPDVVKQMLLDKINQA